MAAFAYSPGPALHTSPTHPSPHPAPQLQGFMFDNCPLACRQCMPQPSKEAAKAKVAAKLAEQAKLAAAAGGGTAAVAADPAGVAAAAAARAAEGQAQGAQKPQKLRHEVADSAAKLRGGADLQAHAAGLRDQAGRAKAAVERQLRLKCSGHGDWSLVQVGWRAGVCWWE